MLKPSPPTILAAGLGGALWTVKATGLMATAGDIGIAEPIAYLAGIAALLAACVLLAVDLARPLKGVARAAATALGAVALLAATVAIEAAGNGLIGGAYTGGNVAIEDEGGILLVGLAWLAITLLLSRRSSRAAYAGTHGQAHEVRAGVA